MTDRELLEMAAKAAGLRVKTWDGHTGVMCAIDNDQYGRMWMPLTDDGDALRLAVKLRIECVYDAGDDGPIHAVYWEPYEGYQRIDEERHIDPYAATRRAIVRAAAEIGRKIK